MNATCAVRRQAVELLRTSRRLMTANASSLVLLITLLLNPRAAQADFATSQEWKLNDPAMTQPDSSSNPAGQTGTLRRDGGTHGGDPYGGSTRMGWTLIGNDSLNFLIPNQADAMGKKTLTAQVIFSIQGNPIESPMLSASTLDSTAFTRTQSNTRQSEDAGVFINETTWTLEPCPAVEQFLVKAPEGRSVFIDNVLIRTNCARIPEPASLVLLLAGGAAMMVLRRP